MQRRECAGAGSCFDGVGAGGAPPVLEDASCERLRLPPQPAPLALGFLVDRSVSMGAPEGSSKWDLARGALLAFADGSRLAELEVAVQLFPARFSDACSASSYEDPLVPFGAAPRVATDIKLAFAYEGPGGPNSPLEPALRGHLAHLRATQRVRPTSQVASILFTDGLPNDCESSWEDVLEVVRESADLGRVATYVVALGEEENLGPLQELADAGGGEVIYVDVVDRGSAALAEALGSIRDEVSACEMTLPRLAKGELVPDSVQLRFDGGGGRTDTWPLLDRPERCAGDNEGFYYDRSTEPRRLRLCPRSCERVRELGAQSLELDVACVRIVR